MAANIKLITKDAQAVIKAIAVALSDVVHSNTEKLLDDFSYEIFSFSKTLITILKKFQSGDEITYLVDIIIAFTLTSINVGRRRGIPKRALTAFEHYRRIFSDTNVTPSRLCVCLAPLVIQTLVATGASPEKVFTSPGISALAISYGIFSPEEYWRVVGAPWGERLVSSFPPELRDAKRLSEAQALVTLRESRSYSSYYEEIFEIMNNGIDYKAKMIELKSKLEPASIATFSTITRPGQALRRIYLNENVGDQGGNEVIRPAENEVTDRNEENQDVSEVVEETKDTGKEMDEAGETTAVEDESMESAQSDDDKDDKTNGDGSGEGPQENDDNKSGGNVNDNQNIATDTMTAEPEPAVPATTPADQRRGDATIPLTRRLISRSGSSGSAGSALSVLLGSANTSVEHDRNSKE